MSARKQGLRPAAKTLPQAIREFLTPAVFKQVRQADSRRKQPRWDVHPLIYVMLLMSWSVGDSLPEKFEVARGFYVVCCPKRKRPGKSYAGFEKAFSRVPIPVLRALAGALRGSIQTHLRQQGCRTSFSLRTYGTDIGRWHYGGLSGRRRLLLADGRSQSNAGSLDGLAGIALSRRADDERLVIDGDRQLLQFVEIVQQPTPFHTPATLFQTAL